MRLRSALDVSLLLAAFAAGRAQAQETIAQVKSAPQTYANRKIKLHGEAVELRGISPRSTRGIYRLADESDMTGVLIRTTRLPETGGPFGVQARLSPELTLEGSLLLDEVDRSADRSPLLPVATGLGILGLIAGAVAFGLYWRARRSQHQMRLGPPMWLIPTAQEGEPEAPPGTEGAVQPPVHFNYRLHYIEEERSTRLEERTRRMLAMAVGCAMVGLVGVGWLFAIRRGEAAKPAFVLMTPTGEVLAAAPPDAPNPPRLDDSLRVGLVAPAADSLPTAVVDSLMRSRAAYRDNPRQRQPVPPTVAPRQRETTVTRVETPVQASTQPVEPTAEQPPPQPPPVVERRDSVAPTPRPDPETLRREAAREIEAGIQRFVGAIAAKQVAAAGALYAGGGEAKRRERFLDFIKSSAPTVTLRGVDAPAADEAFAEAGFTLGFRWRGDFGVDRKKDVRFAATARRFEGAWAFVGARLMEAFP